MTRYIISDERIDESSIQWKGTTGQANGSTNIIGVMTTGWRGNDVDEDSLFWWLSVFNHDGHLTRVPADAWLTRVKV